MKKKRTWFQEQSQDIKKRAEIMHTFCGGFMNNCVFFLLKEAKGVTYTMALNKYLFVILVAKNIKEPLVQSKIIISITKPLLARLCFITPNLLYLVSPIDLSCN